MKNILFKYTSISIAIIAVLAIIGSIACQPSYGTYLRRGTSAYVHGDLDKAIIELTKAIEIDPDLAPGYSWRGSAYYKKAQYDLAIDDLTRAINLDPKFSASDLHIRGLCYYAKGENELAIQNFTEAIKKDHHPYSYNDRGLAYYMEEEYDLAIQDFTTAIETGSHYIEPYSNRADTYIAIGQTALAEADLHKVIELSDDPALIESADERLNRLVEIK
jgi:tetratricopeptide (TPR) repeat protein